MALSISSFDHDGLGRYGDPLDPVGDLKAMRLAQCILKDDGLLLVSVPVGQDVVAFNLHRRYGSVRSRFAVSCISSCSDFLTSSMAGR